MSESSNAKQVQKKSQTINQLLESNLPLIQDEIAKLRNDAKQIISKTIDISPGQVNIVKLTEQKIVIEVNFNKEIESDIVQEESVFVEDDDDNHSSSNKSTDQLNDHNGDHYQSKSLQSTSESNLSDRSSLTKAIGDSVEDVHHETRNLSSRRLVRSVSESDKPTKGILKYPKGWKKRTLSECSYDISFSLTDTESDSKDASCCDLLNHEQLSNQEEEVNENQDDEGEHSSSSKPVKKVTFNRKVFKNIFKKNSTITNPTTPSTKPSLNKKQRKELSSNHHHHHSKTAVQQTAAIDQQHQQNLKLGGKKKVQLQSIKLQKENNPNVDNSLIDEKNENNKSSSSLFESASDDPLSKVVDESILTTESDSSIIEEFTQVKSKKGRKGRKRTDSRSSDHSEGEEDHKPSHKPLSDLHLIRSTQIEVK